MFLLLRILRQSAVLLLLTAAAAALTVKFHPKAPELSLRMETAGLDEITVADALARAGTTGVIWLDARRAEAFQEGHIPGALLLNEYDWENLLVEAFPVIADAPLDRLIVIYCDGQACEASRRVRDKLRNGTPLGDREILVLHGGWPAWRAAQQGR